MNRGGTVSISSFGTQFYKRGKYKNPFLIKNVLILVVPKIFNC